MKRLLRSVSTRTGSPLRRNFALVLRANLLAQLIALASLPILSRLYASSDFGQSAIFASVGALMIAVTTGRFDWLVPNTRNVGSARALMVVGLCVACVTTGVALLIALLLVFFGAALPGKSGLGNAVLLIPVLMLGAGVVDLLQGWFVRGNDLRFVSRSKVAQSSASTAVALAGGVLGWGALGLIWAFIVSRWTGMVMLGRNAQQLWLHLGRLTARRVRTAFLRHRREAGWSVLVSLVNAASLSSTVFMLAAFFTLREVGWYTFMLRIASGPINLIATSLAQSFWSTAAEKARERQFAELRALHFRATRRLASLAIPIVLGCCAGPFVVGPLFGKEWDEAGHVLLAMMPMLVGAAVFSPTNHLVVYQRQAYQLLSDLLSIALSFAAIYLGVRLRLSFAASILMMSIAIFSTYVLRFYLHIVANAEATRAARPV